MNLITVIDNKYNRKTIIKKKYIYIYIYIYIRVAYLITYKYSYKWFPFNTNVKLALWVYIYIYIYRERERERHIKRERKCVLERKKRKWVYSCDKWIASMLLINFQWISSSWKHWNWIKTILYIDNEFYWSYICMASFI